MDDEQDKGRPSKGSKRRSEKKGEKFKLDLIKPSAEDGDATCPFVVQFPAGIPSQLDGYGRDRDKGVVTEDAEWRKAERAKKGGGGGGGGGDSSSGPALKVGVLQNKAPFRTHQRMVVAEIKGVDYVGTTFAGEASVQPICQYALWAVNKNTGRIRVIPVCGNKVVRLEPRVWGVDYDVKGSSQDKEEEKEKEKEVGGGNYERLQKRNVLTETFGSKKNIARVHERNRGQIEGGENDNALVGSVLKKVTMGSAMAPVLEPELQSRSARNIPPHNLEAQTPEKAYPLGLLVSLEEREALDIRQMHRDAKEIEGGEGGSEAMTKYANFVAKRLSLLANLKKEPASNSGYPGPVVALAYLNCLLKFYGAPYNLFRPGKHDADAGLGELEQATQGSQVADSISKSLGIPLVITEILLRKFMEVSTETARVSYRRPQVLTDLMIGYIIVLSLHVDDFETDAGEMCLQLQKEAKYLGPRYRELGCKLEKLRASKLEMGEGGKAAAKIRATLPVPLSLPTVRIGRRQKTGGGGN